MRQLIRIALVVVTTALNVRAAQPPQVKASLSTNNIFIGEIATLKVHVDHPADARVLLPEFAREKKIIARDQKSAPAKTGGTDFEIALTSLTPGSHLVSTGFVTLVYSNDVTKTQIFPELTLRVQSLVTDTNQNYAGLKGPENWKLPTSWLLAWIALGLLVAAVLGVLLARYLKKRAAAPKPLPPPEPPHVKALRALAELKAKQLIEQLLIEPFYVELSDITRRYLEDRFNLRAPEQTTEEFIRATASSPVLSAEHRQLTASFLEQCDLVKFARHQPGADDMRAALAAAERLVNETIPPPPAPASEAKA